MSTVIEDPAIPLVGMNGKRGGKGAKMRNKLYTMRSGAQSFGAASGDSDKSPRFENVGIRLALRKELYAKRKRICDVSLAMAVLGEDKGDEGESVCMGGRETF